MEVVIIVVSLTLGPYLLLALAALLPGDDESWGDY